MRVRELGASMGIVRTMAAEEYFSVVLPPSSLGILAAYAAAFIAALIISRTTGYDMLSAFLPRTALIILAAVIVMLLAALIAALLLFSGRGLHEKKQELSAGAKKAFARRSKKGSLKCKPYLGLGETLVRDGRAHSINTFLVSAASVILAALIAFSATNVYNSIRDYIKYKNEVVDMYAVTSGGGNVVECTVDAQQKSIIEKGRVVIADYDYVNCVMHSIGRDDEYVIPSSVLEKLTEDPGIERLTADTFDSSRAMSWENKEADAFVNALVEIAIHSPIYADKKLVYSGKGSISSAAQWNRPSINTITFRSLRSCGRLRKNTLIPPLRITKLSCAASRSSLWWTVLATALIPLPSLRARNTFHKANSPPPMRSSGHRSARPLRAVKR